MLVEVTSKVIFQLMAKHMGMNSKILTYTVN